MSPTLLLLSLGPVALVVASLGLVREVLRHGQVRFVEDLARRERNRNRFGELRTRLVAMARNAESNVQTEHFAAFYELLTLVMRHPEHHEQAVVGVLALPQGLPRSPEMRPTKAEAEFALAMAHALDQLARDYSSAYRFLAWLGDKVKPDHVNYPLWIEVHLQHRSRQLQKLKAVREAKQRLEVWGHQALAAA